MAVGSNAIVSPSSYLAIGRETTLGTYTTATSSIDFLSCSMKTTRETKVLEEIQRKRYNSRIIPLGKSIEGDIEAYFTPALTSSVFLLQNALGGSVTSTEVTAAASYSHQFDIGSMNLTYSSLCLNERKGDATSGKIWQYSGVRVNSLEVSCEIDDALKMKASVIAMDSTLSGADIESDLTLSCANPLNFISGRLSVENSFASLTSSSFWHIQNFTYSLNNNLKSDAESRRIGSDTLQVLPIGMGSSELNCSIRFDTTTAYDAMINTTKLSAELVFEGDTITGSSLRESLTFEFPVVYVSDAGDPEIGPDEILKSEVSFKILRDCSSATGFAVRTTVVNGVASY